MALNENLKRLRLEKGLTQEETAKEVGVAQPVYNGYEAGLKVPSLGTAKALADLFEVPLDDLVK